MKKWLLSALSLSLLTVLPTVVCVAETADNAKVAPPASTKAPSPASLEKTAPLVNAKAAPLTSRDNEETTPVETPEPCEGMPQALKVEASVQEFLTCEVIQVLAQPGSVESFRVKPDPDPSLPEKNRLGDYPIIGEDEGGKGRNLTDAEVKDLQKLFFAESSYHFGMEKRCRFRPDTGLHFVKGNQSVDVLFSFSCDLWLFVHKGKEKLEDFDPVHKKLLTLRNALFPPETSTDEN